MNMQEKRLTTRLMKYWELLCKSNAFPEIAQFNPATVEDLWPYCCRIAVDRRGELAYKYEYMGKGVSEMNGRDLTGQALDHRLKQFLGGTIFTKLGEVLAGHTPLEHEGHLINQLGGMVKYRACFLPFGTEAKEVTHIIVGISYRVF